MRKLSSYINSDLHNKAKFLHRLTLSLRMQLPTNLANHCWVANIQNRTLTIITDDPNRASLIRFQQREILKLLNQELGSTVKEYLNQIKVSISKHASGTKLPTEAQLLSMENAKLINNCAESIDDIGLKNALRALAKHETI